MSHCIPVSEVNALIDEPNTGVIALVTDDGNYLRLDSYFIESSSMSGCSYVDTSLGTLYVDSEGEVLIEEL